LDQVLAVEFLNFASFALVLHSSRSVWKLGSVQSRSLSSGSTARLPAVEVDQVSAVELNFRTVEPVQHQSRSVEESSNLGVFPVESPLGTIQWCAQALTAVEFLNFRTFEPV